MKPPARGPAWIAIALSLSPLGPARTASAAEPGSTEIAVARGLFAEATAFEREKRWALAVGKLREAIAIKETPGLRYHLAHCEEQLGLLVEALLDYDRARDLIQAGMKAPDVETRLGPARQALAPRVPALVITAPAGVPGLEITIGAHPLPPSALGRPVPVNPGNYRVLARAPGYQDFAREVSMGEGETRVVEVRVSRSAPVPASAAAEAGVPTAPLAPGPKPAAPEPEADSAMPYVVAGETVFALAALGVGIGYLFVKKSASDRVDRAQARVDDISGTSADPSVCHNPGGELVGPCLELEAAIDDPDQERAGLISTLGFVGAGAGAAAALLTYLVWPTDSRSASVQASYSEDTVWLGIRQRF